MSRFVEAETDFGVTDEVIRIGVLADLSGPGAARDVPIVDGQKQFWSSVNSSGGLAGRKVELVVVDTGGEVAAHQEAYGDLAADGDEGVVAIGYSSGTEPTRAIAPQSVADGLMVVTGSRHSANVSLSSVFSLHASLCVEAMNSVAWLDQRVRDQTAAPLRLAIVGDGSLDGDDAVAGARLVAASMGLEVVVDQVGASVEASVIDGSGATGVFVAGTPGFLRQLLAASDGNAVWVGSSPTLDLGASEPGDSTVAETVNNRYFHGWPVPAWGASATAEAVAVQTQLAAVAADSTAVDWHLIGWIQGTMLSETLTRSFLRNDVRRSSLLDVAGTARFSFQGLATAQSWQGDRTDRIVRESYLYDPVGWGDPTAVELVLAGGPDPSTTAQSLSSSAGCGPPPAIEP